MSYDSEDNEKRGQRRETLMDRRLRAARGEEVEDVRDERDERYEYYDDDRPSGPIPMPVVLNGGCGQTILYGLIGVLTIAIVALLVGRQMLTNLSSSLNVSVPESVQKVILTPTPTIKDRGGTVLQIQALNRLETQRVVMERVIETGSQRGDMLDALLGDRLLLIASGQVVAGVDLSRLRAGDVIISPDGETISLRLPPTEIFIAALDNQRTRVYDRDTKLLTQLTNGEDPTLETQARQAAESEILNASCEIGIMQRAADEAQRSMEQFLRSLEFKSVTVVATAGQCVASSSLATPVP